ncbi:MAG: response regulator [Balneolales bacterium]|nr:response regulator [Balneolales bacterium]
MLLHLLLLLPYLFLPTNITEQEYLIKNYTVSDGLPLNYINGIVQDEYGYLYLSTLDGLVRYDGYNFEVFDSGNTSGIFSNRFMSLFVAQNNDLWLLTDTGTITRKSENTFYSYRPDADSFRGSVNHIAETGDGAIWLASSQGTFVWDTATDRFPEATVPFAYSESYILEPFQENGIIAATADGVFLYRNNTTELLFRENQAPLPLHLIHTITLLGNKIWFSSEYGVFTFCLDDNNIIFSHLLAEDEFNVWNVHSIGNGKIVLNTTHGFFIYDEDQNSIVKTEHDFFSRLDRSKLDFEDPAGKPLRFTPNEVIIDGQTVLSTSDIHFSFSDREGGIWLSTFSRGIYHIQSSKIRNLGTRHISGFENMYPVIEADDGAIWAGSLRNGVFRISDNSISNWSADNSRLDRYFNRFLFQDNDGQIYAGMWGGGLWLFDGSDWYNDPDFEAQLPVETTVEAMHHRLNGDLIIGTTTKMVLRRDGTYSLFEPYLQADSDVLRGARVIREYDDGTLFIGTNGNGLSILRDGELLTYTMANSDLSSNIIRDIFPQSADTVWVATENLGLSRMVFPDGISNPQIRTITKNEGLSHNSLHRIIPDDYGYLWISSNGGIMRVPLSALNDFADDYISELPVLNLNEQDGMHNREANGGVQTAGLLSSAGLLYFPNQSGLTIINPSDFANLQGLYTPTPRIKYISYSGDAYSFPENDISILEHGIRNIRIRLSAPNFGTPERLEFRYKLEGVNQNWEDATANREAILTNLPPGEHTFRLAVSRPGQPSEVRETRLSIVIPPRFHETMLFRGFLLFMIVGFIYGGFRYRIRSLEVREQKLQRMVDRQTIDLKEAAEQKSRFFSGITHELKTPLSLIINPLEDLLNSPEHPNGDPEQTREKLKLMLRNSKRLNQLTDQILDVTRLNADALKLSHTAINLPEFTAQIAGQFHSKLAERKINLKLDLCELSEPFYIDPDAYERIVINLLANAIRFSPVEGEISVHLENDDTVLRLQIRDEGPGIPASDHERIFEYLYQSEGAKASEGTGIGLFLVKGLIQHMNGCIEVNSAPGEGATFTVLLQKGYAHFKANDSVRIQEKRENEPDTSSVKTADWKLNNTGANPKEAIEMERITQKEIKTILIVEDNFDFRNYLFNLLSDYYTVLSAADGNEALEHLKTIKVDLVLSDIMMPGMDGHAFVRELRIQEKYKHLPVIFLSARSSALDREAGLQSGADVYLTKPINNNMLLAQIAAILRRESILSTQQANQNLQLQKISVSLSEQNENAETNPRPSSPLEIKVRELIYRHLGNPDLNVNELADALYISRTKLYRDWKEISNVTLNEYIKQLRLNEAKVLITKEGLNVSEAAKAVGYNKVGYFSTSFKKHFGKSPSSLISDS